MFLHFIKIWRARVALLAMACGLVSCGGNRPAAPAARTIVASFYPVYVTVLNVVDGVPDVRVADLAPVALGCPEDYELTPADMKLLAGADTLVINGAGFEIYLKKVAAEFPQIKVVDASAGVPLLKFEGELNPHLWVSPTMAAQQTRNIAAALAAADPVNAATYRKNGEAYAAKQEALAARLHEQLANAPVRRIVAFHDSLPYLARDLDWDILAVLEPAASLAPSARELADVVDKVHAAPGPVALLSEKDSKNPAAEILSHELNQPLFTLDTVTQGPLEPEAARGQYLKAMEGNLATLRAALGVKDKAASASPHP